tara:strand:+ start:650 stop:880 length:231 start_codon:yes stop_codon:yes gene_type:complete
MSGFDDPLKQLYYDSLIDTGTWDAGTVKWGDIEGILSMDKSDILKGLRDLNIFPTISKNMGGIVSLDQLMRPLGVM